MDAPDCPSAHEAEKGNAGRVDAEISGDDISDDEALLAIMQHDPAWSWLRDPAEDLYTEDDVR